MTPAAGELEYLRRVLRMDPREQTAELVAVRRMWQSKQTLPEEACEVFESVEDRNRVLAERISALRERCR